jgi:hypothetical protein
MKKRILLCSFMMSLSLCSIADEMYSWVDESGVKHFSNKPPQGDERETVRGEVNFGKLNGTQLNTMQPFTRPQSTDPAKPTENKAENKSVDETKTPVADDVDKTTQGKTDKSSLQSRAQQLEDYNNGGKAERIKEIKEASEQETSTTPKTISQKLQAYNASKAVNQTTSE